MTIQTRNDIQSELNHRFNRALNMKDLSMMEEALLNLMGDTIQIYGIGDDAGRRFHNRVKEAWKAVKEMKEVS